MTAYTQPTQWTHALGNNADVSTLPDDTAGTTGLASLQKLFQLINQTPLAAGGVAPSREDFNALFKLLGESVFYMQNGGVWAYNATYDYEVGRVVLYTDGNLYKCIQDNGVSSAVKAPTDDAYWQQIPNLKNVTDTCVTLATAQTIAGAKTFSAVTKSATPAASATGTEVVTAAWTKNYCEKKWQDIATEHNNIYRGANLLSGHFASISAVISAISKGDFEDIFVGDYFSASYTVDGTKQSAVFRIAGINYFKAATGEWGVHDNHVCIVPDTLGSSVMNDTNVTTGGYIGSKMYTTVLPKYYAALAGSAGTPFYGHIKAMKESLVNGVDNTHQAGGGVAGWMGAATGWADTANISLCLLSELEIYGTRNFGTAGDNIKNAAQLPMFKLNPNTITVWGTQNTWLRSVSNGAAFCDAGDAFRACDANASHVFAVRPRFAIG